MGEDNDLMNVSDEGIDAQYEEGGAVNDQTPEGT